MVEKKSITLSSIALDLQTKGDFIGSSEPFIVAKVGGFSGRTETCEKDACKFKKNITLNFHQEEEMVLEIWD